MLKRVRMAEVSKWLVTVLVVVAPVLPGGALAAEKQTPETPDLTVTGAPATEPTFHCIGVYAPVAGDANKNATCVPYYRKKGAAEWREGHPLVGVHHDGEFRGSLVGLTPGTTYEIRMEYKDPDGVSGKTGEVVAVETWKEDFPVARTILVEGVQKNTLMVDASGSPEGYVLYAPGSGTEAGIDVDSKSDSCIIVAPGTEYVIIRGLTLKNASVHAIDIQPGSHHVIIERCDITGWGRPEGSSTGSDDGAVYGRGEISHVVVQDNVIHHPRHSSNYWEEKGPDGEPKPAAELEPEFGPGRTSLVVDGRKNYHPAGPQAVTLVETDGRHVIRYNKIFSDKDHWYNDGIGGAFNNSMKGFPHRDTDIYGNYISHCHDDAIESEGGNMNVRIWNNYIVHNFSSIAMAPVHRGPAYVWRNVSRDGRSCAWKLGARMDRPNDGTGHLFIYHNTVFNTGTGVTHSSAKGFQNTASRNNILLSRGSGVFEKEGCIRNSFDYDLFAARPNKIQPDQEMNAVVADAQDVFIAAEHGNFLLKPGSPATDSGVGLPGFNDNHTGKAPDIGAFEVGDELSHYGPRPVKGDAQKSDGPGNQP